MDRLVALIVVMFSSMIFLLPLPAMGQEASNYFVAKAGVYTPTGDLDDDDYDSGFNGEIAFGHYFSPHFALEGGVGYFETDASESDVFFDPFFGFFTAELDSDVWVMPFTLTGKGLIPVEPAEIYIGLGIGIYYVDADFDLEFFGLKFSEDDSDTVLGGHILGGVNYNLSQNVFLGIEGKYIFTEEAEVEIFGVDTESDINGYMITGNLGFRF